MGGVNFRRKIRPGEKHRRAGSTRRDTEAAVEGTREEWFPSFIFSSPRRTRGGARAAGGGVMTPPAFGHLPTAWEEEDFL
jgi:hypothetical protein